MSEESQPNPFAGPEGGVKFAIDYLNAKLHRNDHQRAAELVEQLPAGAVPQALWMMAEVVFKTLRTSPVNIVPEFSYTTKLDQPSPATVVVNVQPAEVTILPTEPKTRTIERGDDGEIVAVHEA